MISTTLMKQTIKSNLPLWLILTGIQMFMLVGIASAGTPLQATGLAYYNMLPELISAVFVIVTANKLIAAQVDKGTMAYILSTPVKRSKVVATQAIFFIGSLFLMFALSAAAHILASYFGSGGISGADVETIVLLNLGMFALDLALSGICFLASGVFNLSKYVVAVGGGIVGAFILMSLMGMFGESFQWMRNFTLVTLYDVHSVMEGTTDFIWQFIVLAAVGVVTYVVASVAFARRDLPL
jgi:ABC-2 type transport system permease protein